VFKYCTRAVPAPFQAGGRNGFPVPTPFGSQYLAVSWDYEDENDAQRLWHDAAMQKTHFFLRFDRKLLKLNLAILGYFCALL
jgi:hypothetical protein